MIPDVYFTAIQNAAGLLKAARHAVAFTGAGISTASGIPDFRSAGTGLWEKDDPMQVASLTSFLHTPNRFYNWLRPLARQCYSAQPNPAHLALAELEELGILKAIITQNIDNLHHRAGSRNVIELHGSLRTFSCPACQRTSQDDRVIPSFIQGNSIPACPFCAAPLKPDIVLFEESLPAPAWHQAEDHARRADVMLIVGSSLTVTPAAYIPLDALQAGAKIIIINLTSTFMDERAEVALPLSVAEALPLVVEQINNPSR